MLNITNVAGYKFARLDDLKALRTKLIAQCKSSGLKGTILLSREGVNFFVAGLRADVEGLLAELRGISGLEDLEVKVSESDHQPFNRMLVHIKKEIIAFGDERVDPTQYTSRKLKAVELKKWLDAGEDVVLLDTRNDYEVKLGTFRNAVTVGLDHFRQFPEAVRTLPESLKNRRIVTFCTGGIRCEKAAPLLELEGFRDVFQLEGGILKYFEECNGEHYDGECFVFDKRVGVNADLEETETALCFACQSPLTAEEQADTRFVKGRSCPYCFITTDEQMARAIAVRHIAMERVTNPLPGSVAYDNYRPLDVPAIFDGFKILHFLENILLHVPGTVWREFFAQNLILDAARNPVGPEHLVKAGDRYLHLQPGTIEPDVNAAIRILHEDEAIIVLHKPAPLPMHPSGRFNRNTVQYILKQAYHPQNPRPGHRLDANTSGVAVFARTRHFAGLLQSQFERGEVEKLYLARVHGHPPADRFTSDSPISQIAGEMGARTIDEENGRLALTEFEVIERFQDQTSLLAVVPKTGRTNQIRLHLWEMGWPIVGDDLYLQNRKIADGHPIDESTLCLLAKQIGFMHPLTKKRVMFEAVTPDWATVSS